MRRKDDEKERCIKEAVIKLILQEGFHGASISKIAKLAGVSPATVYVYFDNKENMLQDIYLEYSEEIFDYVLEKINQDMDGAQMIELLIRSYYNYILEHREVFSFVEQFSNCPSLANGCSGKKGVCNITNLIDQLKINQMVKNYNNENLMAIIFYPIKAIAIDNHKSDEKKAELLQEMIKIIQNSILL